MKKIYMTKALQILKQLYCNFPFCSLHIYNNLKNCKNKKNNKGTRYEIAVTIEVMSTYIDIYGLEEFAQTFHHVCRVQNC